MLAELAIIMVRGIGLGSVFSLVAMSFIIVKVSSGVLNFAQGNLVLVAAIFGYLLSELVGGQGIAVWFVMFVPTVILTGLVLALQGWITLLPLRYDNNDQSWLITTMAVSILIGAGILWLQGPSPVHIVNVLPSVRLMGTTLPLPYLMTFALAVIWFFVLRWFSRSTIAGLAISALWQDQEAARALGLPVRRLQVLAFFVSGLIVGTAGYVAGPLLPISVESGFQFILGGFVVWVIGGFSSNIGALVAGPLVGIIGMFAIYYAGGEFQGLVQTLLLVLILMVRPQGLFGATGARKV